MSRGSGGGGVLGGEGPKASRRPQGPGREGLRMQAAEQARSPRGSNMVTASDASETEVREMTWSRGRELNPRPTDYEAEGRRGAGPQRFCSLRRNCSLRFDVHALPSRDTGAFSRQARTRDHIVSRVV